MRSGTVAWNCERGGVKMKNAETDQPLISTETLVPPSKRKFLCRSVLTTHRVSLGGATMLALLFVAIYTLAVVVVEHSRESRAAIKDVGDVINATVDQITQQIQDVNNSIHDMHKRIDKVDSFANRTVTQGIIRLQSLTSRPISEAHITSANTTTDTTLDTNSVSRSVWMGRTVENRTICSHYDEQGLSFDMADHATEHPSMENSRVFTFDAGPPPKHVGYPRPCRACCGFQNKLVGGVPMKAKVRIHDHFRWIDVEFGCIPEFVSTRSVNWPLFMSVRAAVSTRDNTTLKVWTVWSSDIESCRYPWAVGKMYYKMIHPHSVNFTLYNDQIRLELKIKHFSSIGNSSEPQYNQRIKWTP